VIAFRFFRWTFKLQIQQSFVWVAHGAQLGKLKISLFKPNSQRQDAYRLKASLFLHWFQWRTL
jgi:hypothetical protein